MRDSRLGLVAILAALAPTAALAQDGDLTLPPRVDAPAEAPPAPGAGADPARPRPGERPGGARLAEPVERAERPIEEVVVVGGRRWRLPDLGSTWRQEQEAQRDPRIEVRFFEVYNPNDPTNPVDAFPVNSEMKRVGYIELFRIRFGRP